MKEEVDNALRPATRSAAYLRLLPTTSRRVWAPTRIGTSGWTAARRRCDVAPGGESRGNRLWCCGRVFVPDLAVHDEIGYTAEAGFTGFLATRNNAGGIEGGISNGEEIRVRGYLKPISTLRRPLQSVDFATREPVKAAYERSDVCVVPAAGVAAEAMVALTLARCALEKFGGDSMAETAAKLPRLLPAT